MKFEQPCAGRRTHFGMVAARVAVTALAVGAIAIPHFASSAHAQPKTDSIAKAACGPNSHPLLIGGCACDSGYRNENWSPDVNCVLDTGCGWRSPDVFDGLPLAWEVKEKIRKVIASKVDAIVLKVGNPAEGIHVSISLSVRSGKIESVDYKAYAGYTAHDDAKTFSDSITSPDVIGLQVSPPGHLCSTYSIYDLLWPPEPKSGK